MVKIQLVDGQWQELPAGSKDSPFYMDGILKANLDAIKQIIRNNWDYIYIIDGQVGAGKSIFAQQLGYYADDGNLSLNEITFNSREFEQISTSDKLPKYRSVIFDEAFRGLSSRSTLSVENKKILEILNEIRQKNLFIFIVLPSVWDLDNHVKLHRCRGLFHVHTDKERNRGFYKFYRNDPDKHEFKSFFSNATNRYKYPPFCAFRGRFIDYTPIDRKAYEEKKRKAFHQPNHVGIEAAQKTLARRKDYLMPIYYNLKAAFPSISYQKVSDILKTDRKTLKKWIFEGESMGIGVSNLKSMGDDNEI